MQTGLRRSVGTVLVWSAALGVAAVAACGSSDSSRKDRDDSAAGAAGEGTEPGLGGMPSVGDGGGAAGAEQPPALGGAGGEAGEEPTTEAGAAGVAGAAGAAGAGGAPDCTQVDPKTLAGRWTSTCNGYSCVATIAESGAVSTSCSNGQYATGTLDESGVIATSGEGGAFQPFTTTGTLTAKGCDTLGYEYVGQTPPVTGPQTSYSCELTRLPACGESLLAELAGTWTTSCGTGTCTTTFTEVGAMSSTCSNGQTSTGSVSEVGAFSDTGSGGNFPAYSTMGVIGLTTCDALRMPYTWQSPPNTGNKTSQQCAYTRVP